MAGIDVRDLEITFPLYHGDARHLRAMGELDGNSRFIHDARKRVVVDALRDVSFSLKPGDRLGLVGSNGAGKTTLLRALAGIYEPVGGSVTVHGTVGCLLDPQLGMDMELTGRENIRLRGMFAGLTREQTARVEDDVEEFTALGSFMDLPMLTYSSGMTVRLSFALATAIMPDVLLMDEWFMAGDASFRAKARTRLEGLVSGADILVLSSHMSDIMAEWCNRLIWLDGGRIRMDGPTDTVLRAYASQS
ncbi:MAG: ABC transporter ATP-binding protein [Acetobacter sp.]|uniref:ABC transporter ATP-binding protein n=1 Tax=Acetobacter sp. TaxID=440 RepID=UPI0039EC5CD2